MNEATPTGHNRTLSPDELVLISALKIDLATAILTYLNQARMHVLAQRKAARLPGSDGLEDQRAFLEANSKDAQLRQLNEQERLDAAQPERWIALANTHFQQGLMALVRAVAQPEGF